MRALGPAVVALSLALAGGASAQSDQVVDMTNQALPLEQQQIQVPQPTQMMNLNMIEALIAVGAADLAGVFNYIPEAAGPAAFSDYLLHNRKAFKKFIKKGLKDLKDTGGVNGWDRVVYMIILNVNNQPMLPPGVDHLSKQQEQDLSQLVLARALTLQEMNAARASRR